MRAAAPGPGTTLSEDDLPPLFRTSDRSAILHQSETFRSVRWQLGVLLSATAAAMFAERTGSDAAAVVSALLYALTIAIGLYSARRRARAHWQAHRAVAELLKSLAWQYMVHGGVLHSRVPNADAVFAERLEERLSELRKVGWEDPRNGPAGRGAGQITPTMRAVRAKTLEVRRDIYLRERLLEQHAWYRRKAALAHRSAARWSSVTASLTRLTLLAATLRAADVIGR